MVLCSSRGRVSEYSPLTSFRQHHNTPASIHYHFALDRFEALLIRLLQRQSLIASQCVFLRSIPLLYTRMRSVVYFEGSYFSSRHICYEELQVHGDY